jgi:hypothetical protein
MLLASVVSDLVACLHDKHRELAEELVSERTYAIGVTCFPSLMDKDESVFTRRDAGLTATRCSVIASVRAAG